MAAIWDKEKRSKVMSLVRSHGNKATELRLLEIFRTHRLTGWRRKQDLIGKPDFIFRTQRVCVFVDGCFWPHFADWRRSGVRPWTGRPHISL